MNPNLYGDFQICISTPLRQGIQYYKRIWRCFATISETFSNSPAFQAFGLIETILKCDQYIVTSILTDQYICIRTSISNFRVLFRTWYIVSALVWFMLVSFILGAIDCFIIDAFSNMTLLKIKALIIKNSNLTLNSGRFIWR